MRIWINFINDNGWIVHCLAKDAKTVISPPIRVARESTLLSLLRMSGASEETLRSVSQKIPSGRGTVAVDVNQKGQKLFQIAR